MPRELCPRCGAALDGSLAHWCGQFNVSGGSVDIPTRPARSRRWLPVVLGEVIVGASAGIGYAVVSSRSQPPVTVAATSSSIVSVSTMSAAPAPASPSARPQTQASPSLAASPPGPAAVAARPISVPSETIVCSTDGTGLAATSMADNTWTSCIFADIVRQRYREAAPGGGAVSLPQVYTPKFGRYWDLVCENTEPVHCYAPADGQVVVYLRRN